MSSLCFLKQAKRCSGRSSGRHGLVGRQEVPGGAGRCSPPGKSCQPGTECGAGEPSGPAVCPVCRCCRGGRAGEAELLRDDLSPASISDR